MAEPLLFTQKELILLTQTHADIRVGAHEVRQAGERGWELRIPYQDKKNQTPQHMTLVTARGSVRTFKNLDTVVDYVNEHCPHIQAFAVYFRESIKQKIVGKTTKPNKSNRSSKSNNKQVKNVRTTKSK
jgi:hypothetical protein